MRPSIKERNTLVQFIKHGVRRRHLSVLKQKGEVRDMIKKKMHQTEAVSDSNSSFVSSTFNLEGVSHLFHSVDSL